MIAVGTRLRIIDNSGAKEVECIKILGESNRLFGYVGDIIIVSVKTVNPIKKIKKGEIFRAVIVCTKKGSLRLNGDRVVFGLNGAVIISNKNIPIATRILGPVMLELRYKNFLKVVSMATVAI